MAKRHIFLIGPPAVGKLTVGQALATRTAFPLYDNTLAVDVASKLFSYGTREFREYRDEQRLTFYSRATESSVQGLISTACVARTSWPYFDRVEEVLSAAGWTTIYILLDAARPALLERVVSVTRRSKTTLLSPTALVDWLDENWPPILPVDRRICRLDTSKLAASETSEAVAALL
jgi:shikimate kinase